MARPSAFCRSIGKGALSGFSGRRSGVSSRSSGVSSRSHGVGSRSGFRSGFSGRGFSGRGFFSLLFAASDDEQSGASDDRGSLQLFNDGHF